MKTRRSRNAADLGRGFVVYPLFERSRKELASATRTILLVFVCALLLGSVPARARSPLVFYTDFGLADGAVAAMKGVAYSISQDLVITDLSHENPGSIFAGAYRLAQAADFWPKGTVFVTVIDPGVGTERLPIALKTLTGRVFIAPNNGLLTFIAEHDGVAELRRIDESINRRPGSEESHTFHGRDIFGYTGARLAAGLIAIEDVGPLLPADALMRIPYPKSERHGELLTGIIPVLDTQFGNVWTNISLAQFKEIHPLLGQIFRVRIVHGGKDVVTIRAPYHRTFGEAPPGKPLLYANSLMQMAIALNLGDFARKYHIGYGPDWRIEIQR